MYPVYKSLGVKEECKDVKVQFPPQHQECQPGLEYIMMPRPISNNPYSRGSGKLQGKVAIITGGDSGIGRAIAYAFAKEGADITISYLNEEEDACETKAFVEQIGRRCLLVPGDLKNEEMSKIVVEKTIECFGKIDILVNNAAKSEIGLFMDFKRENINNLMNINLLAPMYLSQAVLPSMISKGSGNIINISSIWGETGASCEVVYSTTKGGLNLFTKSLAKEVAPFGIRVNAIAPGVINTEMNSFLSEDEKMKLIEEIPMGRFGNGDEVANTVVFLCQNDISYLTGQIIKIDGGFL